VPCCTQVRRLAKPLRAVVGQCYLIHPAQPHSGLFGALKEAIHHMKFEINDDVYDTFRTWLHEQDKVWEAEDTHTHTHTHTCTYPRWHKAGKVEGEFVKM